MRLKIGTHTKGTISMSDIIQDVKPKPNFSKAGAVATFTGVVRGKDSHGNNVQKLLIEAYEEKADEVLISICSDLRKRRGILDVQIHHLLGEFTAGEDLVYVLVAGEHRKETFSALEEAVERYKKEVPIFKKEFVTDKKGGTRSHWVTEEREQ